MSLTAIYTAYEGMSVSVGAVTPSVKGLSDRKQSINSADLPVRLMLLASSQRGRGDGFEWGDINQNFAEITWTVVDLLLWEKFGQGLGMHAHDPDLATYMTNYLQATFDIGGGSTNYRLQGLEMVPGIYEWPIGSGTFFFGVQSTLFVREVDP